MEPGATLRYTGSRPRRRSLESLIKQAALLSNSGASNEDTTRHSGQDADSNDVSESAEEDDDSSSSSSSSSASSEESISETSSSSAESGYEIEQPARNAPSFFDNHDILEREFRSAFLPEGIQSPSRESSPQAGEATIDEVCGHLQSILSELSTINKKIDSSSSLRSEESSRVMKRATALGVAAVDLGKSSITHFSDKMRLTPTPEELKESHPRQLALLNKMRAAINQRDAPPQSLDKIHSIYSGHPSSAATMAPAAPASDRYDTIDDYLYNSNAPVAGGSLECRQCHRHFGSMSTLGQHEKTCGGGNSPPSFSTSDPARRLPCRHCGRLMTTNALAHHENICIRIFHGRRKHTPPSANELAS